MTEAKMNEGDGNQHNKHNSSNMDVNNKISVPSSIISNADQECVSFLMTLKHRTVTPPLSSRPHAKSRSSSLPKPTKENDTMHEKYQPCQSTPGPYMSFDPSVMNNQMFTPCQDFKTSRKGSSMFSQESKPSSSVTYDCFDTMDDYHKSRPAVQVKASDSLDNVLAPVPSKLLPYGTSNSIDISDEKLIDLMGETTLVEMQDKDLVPDYLFLAMAQMQPCHLTDADRVGCYKDREIGFLGMSCKHCCGQPGFGKYFPGTVRSLAQTTTSQTIVKHIAVKCRLCPPEIRQTVLALQKDQADKDRAIKDDNRGGNFDSRPRYGSRKIFFQRLWSRLHGGRMPITEPSVEPNQGRNTVVSPNCQESLSSPTQFTDRCPPVARHITRGEESSDDSQTEYINSNDYYHTNQNGKRSRAVSYVHEEDDFHLGSHARRKMSRVVTND